MKKAKLLLSCSVAIVGSVAVDLMCKLTPEKYDLHDSNPGKSSTLIGGVGFNVFLAAHYASKDRNAVRFISQVGNDLFGDLVLSDLSKKNIDTSGIIRNPAQNTARYVLIHDKKGDLVVACADMGIAENFDSQRLSEALEKADPKVVLVDSNVSEDTILQVQKLSSSRKLVIEPTSSMKAGKLAKAIGKSPHSFIFTNHIQRLITEGPDSVGGLVLATPTVAELRRIHDSMDENELFDVDKWFPIIDAIGVNSDFRNKMDSLKSISFPQNILKEGIIQQAVKLLPYIPSIIVKLGQDGVLMINMTMDAGKLEDDPNNHIIVSKGKEFDLFHQLGVVVQWCPVPEKVTDIVNVTGAGDAFVGYLVLKMAEEGCSWLFEPGKLRENVLNGAQRAAAVCLMDEAAISEKIKYI